MKKTIYLFVVIFAMGVLNLSSTNIKPISEYNLESHDISSLPDWGPYSKQYAGISHIPNMEDGLRFDFSVMPGYYRNKLLVPHVLFESSYFPWNFSPSMRKFTYRYELEWKDQVYCDVTYYVLDQTRVLVEMKSVNNTSVPQNLIMNNIAYIAYPEQASHIRISGLGNGCWYNAIDYKDLIPNTKTPQFNLVYDGWKRNEELSSESVCGSIVGKGFGLEKGDKLTYDIIIDDLEGTVTFRYRMQEGKEIAFLTNGLINDRIVFKGSGDFTTLKVPYKITKPGSYELGLISEGGNAIELDGFHIGTTTDSKYLAFERIELPFTPQTDKGESNQDFILKYQDIDSYYGLAWNFKDSEIREVLNSELESFFRRKVHDHVSATLVGDKKWHYTNAFLRPIVVQPESQETLYALLSTGTKTKVTKDISDFHNNSELFIREAVYISEKENSIQKKYLPNSERFLFGQKLLQASILSNISYPIYTQREYIRHFTPGKNWNSLYTWDLGFIALGLIDIDLEKAFEAIKAYTTPVGNQSAFIHHGTPLPIQMFACLDLWNADNNIDALKFLYPRLKQYYDFMAGRNNSSTTRMEGSNLLKTWDYFYNSGGWDDYPPQYYFHNNDQMNTSVTPVVSTAFYIRAAKILRLIAKKLKLAKDIRSFDNDIKLFTDALQKYSWDEQAGYFSYVVHDDEGNPVDIYRFPQDNSNFNKGLDGVSPLLSGICTKEQQDILIENIFSEDKLWTKSGISTVDRSASYFKGDGYWNGAVWMPHQWTTWKALLDCGEGEKAFKIAQNALNVWEKECRESYHTFEHFIISSGRGAGWHQFSGLSSPIINWFSSYYEIGKVTTGFEIWIKNGEFSNNYTEYNAIFEFDDSTFPRERSFLVCLNPDYEYSVTFNKKEVKQKQYYPGLLEITLPETNKKGEVSLKKKE